MDGLQVLTENKRFKYSEKQQRVGVENLKAIYIFDEQI